MIFHSIVQASLSEIMNKTLYIIVDPEQEHQINFSLYAVTKTLKGIRSNLPTDIAVVTNITKTVTLALIGHLLDYSELESANIIEIFQTIITNKDRDPVLYFSHVTDYEEAFKIIDTYYDQASFDLINVDDVYQPNYYIAIVQQKKLCPHSKADLDSNTITDETDYDSFKPVIEKSPKALIKNIFKK